MFIADLQRLPYGSGGCVFLGMITLTVEKAAFSLREGIKGSAEAGRALDLKTDNLFATAAAM